MAGPSDQPTQSGATAVPDLIERYRSRRDAWIAQADELARLRDEVRGSAEREAMEIVTAARRDVRKVIMEARRELLVLSAQVQAALGEATLKTDPAALLDKAGITPDPAIRNALFGSTAAFAPEDAVNEILSEVRDDMTALAEDARALPLQAGPPRRISSPPSPSPLPETISLPTMRIVPSIAPALPTAPPSSITAPASMSPLSITPPSSIAPQHSVPTRTAMTVEPATEISEITFPPPESGRDDRPSLSESASKVLLSSPFPSDAVPVQNDKRFRAFVALFVGVAATLAGVSMWWLSSGNSGNESAAAATSVPSEASAPSVAGDTSAPASAASASAGSARSNSGANLSVIVEAVRDVWIRTTIDGRTDGGRTLTAGQSIDISGEQTIALRAGDAGAVMVSFNSGEKRPLGRDGEVVTRQFAVERTAEPVRAPAPQTAPTARAVPAPQPTPAAPRPSAPARMQPPVASATPAVAPRVVTAPTPPATGSLNAVNPPAPPVPTASTPASAPGSTVSQQTSNASQVAVPPSVVNQLSAPAAPLAAPAAVPTAPSPATVVVAIARQWLDAYHRQDRATMAALSTENLLLADERRADERFPSGLIDVTRTLDRVSVQIAADTAVLTAVMMEQSTSAPSAPRVSPISQVWVLGGGQWKVRQARFVSEARLNSVFK